MNSATSSGAQRFVAIDPVGNKAAIDAESVRIVYRQRFRNLFSHFIASGLPLTIGWTEKTWRINLLLLSILWVYTFAGLYFTHKFNSSSIPDEETPLWGRVIYYQFVPLGILYNAIFMHLAYYGVEDAMFYLILTSALYCAGAISSYQHLKWLGPLFVVSVMAPQCVYYATVPAVAQSLFVSFIIAVAVAFMTNASMQLHKNAIHALSLTYELKAAKEEAEQMALSDVLTGLNNRRAFYEVGQALFANAHRRRSPISVIMLDVDFFKKINDRYGHATGDKAIIAVAESLRTVIRESDLAGRIGGEEFAVILPETGAEAARLLAERIREEIQKIRIDANGDMVSLTASLGVAQYDGKNNSLDAVIAKADQALYRAKEGGRNQTSLYNDLNGLP